MGMNTEDETEENTSTNDKNNKNKYTKDERTKIPPNSLNCK